jgi:hypothetical protein
MNKMAWFDFIRAETDINPHSVASDAKDTYPCTDASYPLGVTRDDIADGEIVSGEIEFFVGEHPTSEQEQWLRDHPHIVDYRLESEEH